MVLEVEQQPLGRRFGRRAFVLITCACLVLTIWSTLTAPVASASPVTPSFPPEIDALASYQGQTTCDPTAKPGVVDFRDLLNQTYGHHGSGITRPCDQGPQSEHKEGRALDYSFNVNNAEDVAEVNDLLNWLFASDQYGNTYAMVRRLGIMYIIWNRQIWAAYRPNDGWQPYTGDPHTDHIHVSFSWAGARRETTWWTRGVAATLSGVSSDVTGDGRPDVLARDGNGELWVYPHDGRTGTGNPYLTRFSAGTGWNIATSLSTGDVTGDGRVDVLARDGNGELWVYPHDGRTGTGNPYLSRSSAGTGWNIATAVTAGDVTGDGRVDVLARDGNGELWVYPHDGRTGPGNPYLSRYSAGTGWNIATALT